MKVGTSAPTVTSAPGGSRGRARAPLGGALVDMEHTVALWALVALELGALVALRRYFRRHHGG